MGIRSARNESSKRSFQTCRNDFGRIVCDGGGQGGGERIHQRGAGPELGHQIAYMRNTIQD
jgi:hypothetical protein